MIGKRLYELRRERNLSLSELAKRSNVAKSYLSAIERHIQVNPSLHVLERISRVLNVQIQTLLGESSVDGQEE
ncbi:helix-turn-helix domain-containing protein [Alicyclobacillus fastidiosus]|uniref:Helix-turn-helix domain-containing protein n=1 Tax=Alicyclobacillus fastidiosus TaxID=392011 RepID=A0ABY6ZAR1_9BACL|nr:helix-turn-helix transcriptional regulator [Alicyclobacillus fastidiosus]WAH39909.1 helix-turn-helix domain-containing protein [Alicyclobacillus fastidiosus]GMA61182.1 hypothetical protein GCM10025859_16220 [Alicyclobacillus fastidiosus]